MLTTRKKRRGLGSLTLRTTALLALVLGMSATPALADNADFLGTWNPNNGQQWTITSQEPDGACAGTSSLSGFTLTDCVVSGDHYEFTVEEAGYSSYNHGTIEGNSLTGEFDDTFGHEIPYTAVREAQTTVSIAGEPDVALPESGSTTETFTVSLSEASSEPVEVDYETQDGTATVKDDDYTEQAGVLTFAPGETSKPVEVAVDDGNGQDSEALEHYDVALTRATGGVAVAPAASVATGTIGLPGFSGHTVDGHGHPLAGATLTLSGRPRAGGAVTREITTDSAGAYTVAADPGEYSIYAHGVPAGQPSGLKWTPGAACPGKPTGAYCEKIELVSSNGKPASAKVDFAYGAEDPEAENLEVLQAVQRSTFDTSGPQITLPDGSKASSFAYSGVGLAAGSQTLVRLYGANNGSLTAETVPAQLRAYSGSGSSLTELPGGPVAPLDNNLNLIEAPRFDADRADATSTYNFVLPEAWTKAPGPITLVGTVDPEKKFVECAKCRENDSVAVSGVTFTEVHPLKFIPMSLQWTQAGKAIAPSDPVTAVTRTWPYWPLPTNGLEAVGAPVSVDLTEALEAVATQLQKQPAYKGHPLTYQTNSLVGCLGWNGSVKLNEACVNLIEPKLFAAEKAALGASAGTAIAVGVYENTGLTYGVLGAANAIGGKFSYVPYGEAAVVVHEMMHELGFKHSGCTGPSDEEAWPANPLGQAALLGYGVNRSNNSSGGIGSIYSTTGTAAGEGRHDIMSYCAPTWPSAFNWDRTLQVLAKGEAPKPFSSYPAYSGAPATSSRVHTARHGDVVTVQSINVAGTQTIAEIEPGAQAEGGKASGYTFEALNAHDHVIARAPAMAIDTHADVFAAKPAPDDEITILQVELPAKGLAGVALLHGKHLVSSERAPHGKLTLSVQKISRKACRHSGPLVLKFRARPNGALFRSVRVLAPSGRRRKPIEIGSHHGAIALRAGARPKRARKLFVEFSDGFAAITRSVAVPKGCRAG